MNKQIASLSLVALTLVGCMKVGPNFETPTAAMQCSWVEEPSDTISNTTVDLCQWWQLFDDPTLNALIAEAELQNLSLQAAAMRIRQARTLLAIATGETFPQEQQIVGSADKVSISKNAPNTAGADLNYLDYRLGLQATWELDFWGRYRRSIEAAAQNLNATIDDYRDVLVILLADVASTYVALRTTQERITILNKNIAIQQRSLEIVEARFDAGMVTELDLQQAKALLADTQARLPALETDLRRASNGLALLLGTTPEAMEHCWNLGDDRIPAPPSKIWAGAPADLLCRRPDIRRSLHLAAAQCAKVGIAVSDLLPHFTIGGLIGLHSSGDTISTRSGQGGKLFDSDSFSYSFGPGVAWPILNYGRINNKVRFEYARLHERVADYRHNVLFAYREVEDALTTFINSRTRVAYLDTSATAAERSADLSRTQYVEGIADYTRVLNSEQVLLQASEALVVARGEEIQSVIVAYRALGGGW